MTAMPTAEQFLAHPQPDDEEPEELQPGLDITGTVVDTGDPLESIADSMRQLVALTREADEPMVSATAYAGLSQEHADLEDKHRALFELLADVEKIVSKSKSKLADDVRSAIATWRNPEAEEPTAADPAAERPVPAANATEMGLEQPAHDAPVEEWREYVRAVRPAEFRPTTLDTMNRSQIRTYLGIEHGGAS